MWRGGCFHLGSAVIGWQSAAARPGYAINAVRIFGRRQLTSAKHQSLLPVQEVEGTSQGVRDLLRPFAFAVAVTGASFTGAAIWQYEGFRQLAKPQPIRSGHYNFYGKAGDFRHRLNAWWNHLCPAEKVVCGIIAANAAVFLAWRVPQLTAFMTNYFMASPMARATALPMLLSSFSHYDFLHLFINMYVLWSFAPDASVMYVRQKSAFSRQGAVPCYVPVRRSRCQLRELCVQSCPRKCTSVTWCIWCHHGSDRHRWHSVPRRAVQRRLRL